MYAVLRFIETKFIWHDNLSVITKIYIDNAVGDICFTIRYVLWILIYNNIKLI